MFVLNKGDDNGEGDAFIGRFSVNSESITPVWMRAFSNSYDLSGLDVKISPNGGITAAIIHKGPLQVEDNLFFGDEGGHARLHHGLHSRGLDDGCADGGHSGHGGDGHGQEGQ